MPRSIRRRRWWCGWGGAALHVRFWFPKHFHTWQKILNEDFFSSGKSERTIKTFLGKQERHSADWRVNRRARWIGD